MSVESRVVTLYNHLMRDDVDVRTCDILKVYAKPVKVIQIVRTLPTL